MILEIIGYTLLIVGMAGFITIMPSCPHHGSHHGSHHRGHHRGHHGGHHCYYPL